ncbi:hypothetical protein SAMN02745166_01691 [Prosthecobacter debontii]|uniref:Uncharacterized protein n=1 Tax=Prosthecobacter debontii TaxID=48467 RepID=A0A1T4XMC6_9BACT|nr:hypothetical protein [Prosthecobacter debontii]SKA90328.1 hypothetical protein SAMN02745166_01691 [Prosthecobacter debontii]
MSTDSNTVENKVIDTATSLGSGEDILDQDVAARQQLFLARTLLIQTICLNNEQSAHKYLLSILTDPLNDQLNRGFHLVHYASGVPRSLSQFL